MNPLQIIGGIVLEWRLAHIREYGAEAEGAALEALEHVEYARLRNPIAAELAPAPVLELPAGMYILAWPRGRDVATGEAVYVGWTEGMPPQQLFRVRASDLEIVRTGA